jgi:hypothetical protein
MERYCLCILAIKSKKILKPLNGKYLSGSAYPSLFTDLGGNCIYYFCSSGYLIFLAFEKGVTAVPASLIDFTDLIFGGGSLLIGECSMYGGYINYSYLGDTKGDCY